MAYLPLSCDLRRAKAQRISEFVANQVIDLMSELASGR
jgi:hypothetical protein